MGALIWLASYPKSGNTWTRAFLYNLLRNPVEPGDINEMSRWCIGEDRVNYYQKFTPKEISNLTPEELGAIRQKVHTYFTTVYPDSVFVKTHNVLGLDGGYPLINMKVTAGAIYIVRNPLDVVLSYANHFGKSIDQSIVAMAAPFNRSDTNEHGVRQIFGSWSSNVASWTQKPSPQIHIMRYEDMLDDPEITFGNLARFLGLDPPQERLKKAIKFASFDELQKQENSRSFKERSPNSRFFRIGKKDQWKEHLTKRQIRTIIRNHSSQMERFSYIPEGY